MNRIEILEQKVRDLYAQKNIDRAEWADWLADNHVFIVADNASVFAQRFGANEELAKAAALLHDIADATMSRFDENHEAESMKIARKLLQECGYNDQETAIVVDDAIRLHSCHDGNVPTTLEGKVLATADSLAHLQTDFYIYATWIMGKNTPLDEIKAWVLKKLERDFHNKILFDEVKTEVQQNYEMLKELFSR